MNKTILSSKKRGITSTQTVLIALVIVIIVAAAAVASVTLQPPITTTVTNTVTQTVTQTLTGPAAQTVTVTAERTTTIEKTVTITTTQATTATPQPTGRYGGTLIIGAEKQEDTLDPLNALTGPFAGTGMQAIFEALIYYGPGGEFIPGLATSWMAESPTVWVFTIRQGVKFHDGTILDAAAVKANFDRHIQNPKAVKSIAFLLDSVNVRDQYTVEFRLKPDSPYADFLTYLASDVYGLITSPTAVQKWGDKFGRNPVGTGPFKFVEWVDNDHLTLEANNDYWGGRPYLDKIIVRVIPETSVRILALKNGEIHLTDIPAQFVKTANTTGVVVRSGGSFRLFMMSLNNNPKLGNPVFQDVRVRQALNYAINREALIQAIEQGFATPATGSLIPGLNDPWYNPNIKGYPPKGDVAKAKQLLAEAGYPNGIDIEIEVAGVFANGLDIATILQQQLAAANIRVKIKNVDFSVFIEDLFRKRSFELAVHDQAGASPYNLWYTILHSKGRNLSNINDTELDTLIEQIGKTTDFQHKKELVDKVTQLEIEKAYQVYLYYVPRIQGWSEKLKGYTVTDPHYWGSILASKPLSRNAWLEP
ncbi:MAG: ABC transporter substrate-binding protein [Nitrososphaerales archaeon]